MLRFAASSRVAVPAAWAISLRGFTSQPKFEISEVNDDPSKGYMVRVALDDKKVYLSYYPQCGPRKSDPLDPTPQFDFRSRRSLRFHQFEIAGLLAVCEGKAAQFRTQGLHKVVFEKTANNGFALSGSLNHDTAPTSFAVSFEGYQGTHLHHFLESALSESFGFRAHFAFLQERERSRSSGGGRNFDNNWNNSNSGGNNRNQRQQQQ